MELRWVLACVVLGAATGPHLTTGEVFTSIQELTAVFSLERRVVTALVSYVDDMETKLLRIRKYLREYEQVSAEGAVTDEVTMERLAGNPVHAFHLMKRLTVDWRHLEDQAKVDPWMDVLSTMRGVGVNGVRLPREEDLQGAAQALVRLHDVYNLNTTQLAKGNLWGVQSAAELTAQDCLYMGKHSFNLGLHQRAVQWFEEAYALAGMEGNATVTQDQVNVFLDTAIRALDDNTASHLDLGRQQDFSTSLRDKPPAPRHRLAPFLTPQEDAANFQALCRGKRLLSDAYEATLKCFHDWRGDHYLRLMPARVERHHWDPELLTFHHVISDQEIQDLQHLSAPILARAMVQGPQGKGNTVSNTRTSKVGWLDDSHDALVARLGVRVQRLTGLATSVTNDDAEMLQVANYGIGGHYNPHHDYLLVDKTEEEMRNIHPREAVLGDRIATFMFYLSDVKRGGATAFPRLGTAVWPSKGSAAFWYNLKRSGRGSLATLHGACPVVHGSKWVSNKWIRERGQFLRRTCSLSPDE